MSEHRIKLRGGWEYLPHGSAPSARVRCTLPTCWTFACPQRLQLFRRFGRPPYEPACQSLILELDRVPGTRSIELNGRPIVPVSPCESRYEIPLSDLPERNVLVLEVDVPDADTSADAARAEWGHISLVIRTAGSLA